MGRGLGRQTQAGSWQTWGTVVSLGQRSAQPCQNYPTENDVRGFSGDRPIFALLLICEAAKDVVTMKNGRARPLTRPVSVVGDRWILILWAHFHLHQPSPQSPSNKEVMKFSVEKGEEWAVETESFQRTPPAGDSGGWAWGYCGRAWGAPCSGR